MGNILRLRDENGNWHDVPALVGPKGDAFTYDDFTEDQLKALTGSSIESIERTDGTGAPGTVDTYTITLTNGDTHTFEVRNGSDGDGAGDMTAVVYDPQGKATDIYQYVDEKTDCLYVTMLTYDSDGLGFTVDKTVDEIIEAYNKGSLVMLKDPLTSTEGVIKLAPLVNIDPDSQMLRFSFIRQSTVYRYKYQDGAWDYYWCNALTNEGDISINGNEEFNGRYLKRYLGYLEQGDWYDELDDVYKDGTYHRMWRLRFPTGSDFWGRLRVTLIGTYNSYNAIGVMSKTLTIAFSGDKLYNNLGAYTELGGRTEKDFRISEALWNADANAWEVLIWQDHLYGNNYASVLLEAWYRNDGDYETVKGIEMTEVELTQLTEYTANCWKGNSEDTRTVDLEETPVYEAPYGERVYHEGNLPSRIGKTYLGDFEGKTIADLRTALDEWLDSCGSNIGICQFSVNESFVDLWNAEDVTTTLESGSTWTCNVIGGCWSADYTQLMVSSYYTDAVHIFTKQDGVWLPISDLIHNGYNKELVINSNIKGNYLVGEWLKTEADTHRSEAADKYAVLDGSGWIYHRTPDEVRSDIGAASNPNLLDNWYFADPIDQRGGYVVPKGANYYTTGNVLLGQLETAVKVDRIDESGFPYFTLNGNQYWSDANVAVRGYVGVGYGIDRWRMVGDYASVVVDSGFVTIHGNTSGAWLYQPIENKDFYIGKMVTFSALYDGNVLCTISGVIDVDGQLVITDALNGWDIVALQNDLLYVQFSANAGTTKSILAAKLELGSTQTLAHQDSDGNWVLNDPPPNKDLELLKCCMSTADSADTYANNNVAPAAINAVNKAGDTMTGSLVFSRDGVELATITSIAGFASFFEAYDGNGNKNALIINPTSGVLQRGYNDAYSEILHTGNKPTGSYTGNGDATARTIATGGIGRVIAIYCDSGFAIVTPLGAIVAVAGESTPVLLGSNEATFYDGTLTLATQNGILNGTGKTCTYQVL